MATAINPDGNEVRKKRAEERYVRLVYLEPTTKAVQRMKGDSWGDAHLLKTSDGTADECSCPDCQKSGNKCYHMEAWDEWTFDEVMFHTGEQVQL
jgi:hypothetical protein